MIYQHILVAIDDSDTAKSALNEAVKLAKADPNIFIRIIHIIEPLAFMPSFDTPTIPPDEMIQSLFQAGNELLLRTEAELRKQNVQNVETHLIELKSSAYRIEEKICEEANAWPADLILIGTHGRRGFHRFLLGSVAEGVIRIATVPVLLIRGQS